MAFPFHLVLAFIAAFVFAVASLCFKRAFEEGAKLPHIFIANHLLLGLVFAPCFLLSHNTIPWKFILHPIITGTAFFIGNLVNFRAIRTGDVSLVAPLMGSKVIFVGFLAGAVFGHQLTFWQWFAATLTAVGVFALGFTDIHATGRVGVTTVLALTAGFLFALCDVCIQAWAGTFGLWPYLAVMFCTVALLSLVVLPLFTNARTPVTPRSRTWIGIGAVGSVLQSGLVAGSIAWSGDAAGVNVLYNTRGLWSIVLVWFVAHWFGSTERERGQSKMLWRTSGALLMALAVFLTVFKSR